MSRKRTAFTLVELLVVIAIIGMLAGMLLPVLSRAREEAWIARCSSNLRQFNLVLRYYADNWRGYYPLEPTEHNPHPDLLSKLRLEPQDPLVSMFYCPSAGYMEQFAQNPNAGPPKGQTDTIVDTPENRLLGNFTYIPWSFAKNKPGWRNSPPFSPRQLHAGGAWPIPGQLPPVEASPSARWVASDFFRRGAPFPHLRNHKSGLNITFLDGHVKLTQGRPQDNFK